MTHETDELDQEIKALKAAHRPKKISSIGVRGYNMAITILTDLLGCIFIGWGIGHVLQITCGTSPLLTAGLTLLGGVSGLYTTIRYALAQEKKQ